MSDVGQIDLSAADIHWLKWAVPTYISSYQYLPLTNEWWVTDKLGRAHCVPNNLLLNQNLGPGKPSLPIWIFGLYLDCEWPKDTGNAPRLRTYDTHGEELAALNHELDIYRGVVPTPPGYVANPARVKVLMQRLAELNKEK